MVLYMSNEGYFNFINHHFIWIQCSTECWIKINVVSPAKRLDITILKRFLLNYLRQGGYVFARFVCLCVCEQDNSKTYGRILLKFSGYA